MTLSRKDKESILNALSKVDVKQMEIEHVDPRIVKWFRFGSYNGIQIAAMIIKAMPEKKPRKKPQEVS